VTEPCDVVPTGLGALEAVYEALGRARIAPDGRPAALDASRRSRDAAALRPRRTTRWRRVRGLAP
jgi:hypothetical protein